MSVIMSILGVGVLGGLGVLGMLYWRRIMFALFLYTFYFWRIFFGVKRWFRKGKDDLVLKGKTLGDLYKWDLSYDGKLYRLHSLSKELSLEHAKETLDNRRAILYACLKNDEDDVMIELTADLRTFYPFFYEDLPFHVFLRYLQANSCRSITIDEFYLSLYYNDRFFTEKKVAVRELWDKSFASVMTY